MKRFNQSAVIAVFSVALAGAASPALAAWQSDTIKDDEAGIFYDFAYVTSANGAGLEVGCYYEEEPYFLELYITVYTGEAYDATASYAPSVPLLITAGGSDIALIGKFGDVDGELVVDVGEHDDAAVFDALEAIEYASAPIEIAFFQTRLSFPAENALVSVGHVIDSCL